MASRVPEVSSSGRRIEAAVRRALSGRRVVLAISGGRDSMALLHAASRAARESIVAVATFDHGTGPAASRAAALVASEAARLGFPAVLGHARRIAASEAAWRDERRAFLAEVLSSVAGGDGGGSGRARVVTGHTSDDHAETVLMRIMRNAGPRGLAGLYAPGDVSRPFLAFARADVAAYAVAVGARWVDDPSNSSMRFLRNRVRRDLLPALCFANPGFGRELLRWSRDAAAWRRRVDAAARALCRMPREGGRARVPAVDLAQLSVEQLAVLWPAIAALAGATLDRRGTERAAAFTSDGRIGARMPLSGGWEISRTHEDFELRRAAPAVGVEGSPGRLAPGMRFSGWRFMATRAVPAVSDPWVALLPPDAPLSVRSWRPGDRMRIAAGATRKVKRFLSDARLSGPRRAEWPVVLSGDDIVWIPGVRRSDAAAVRPGRPGVLYRCALDDR